MVNEHTAYLMLNDYWSLLLDLTSLCHKFMSLVSKLREDFLRITLSIYTIKTMLHENICNYYINFLLTRYFNTAFSGSGFFNSVTVDIVRSLSPPGVGHGAT